MRSRHALLCALAAAVLVAAGLPSWTTPANAAGPCDAPIVNPIVCENSKPGNPESEWGLFDDGIGDPSIQGFATDISVNRGGTISFKIDTDASAYTIDIYRLGYYGGMGARKVATITPSASLPQIQPDCLEDPSTGLIDCGNWGVSASWNVPADAVSGIYIARPKRSDTNGASHIPFIVRDDASTAPLFFQTSDTTWQAYNDYGGNSLYVGSPAGRAYKVSYNRPFTTRATFAQNSFLFNSEFPMLFWLEQNGYDVAYTTGVDTARAGQLIKQHKVFLSVGHDEYWSAEQRANVEAARDAGVHLAFFSGNEVFWKTRWEPSIDGTNTNYRTMVSYKETHANEPIDPADPPTWTGTWRDPRFSPPGDGGRPENALTGTIFMVNGVRNDSIEVPAADGKMRFWRNTSIASLPANATAKLPAGTLGFEWDSDLDNGHRPPGLIRMSTTTLPIQNQLLLDHGSTYGAGNATHNITLYRAPSGALVFGAGTVQWAWGLSSWHDRGSEPADPRMQQATVNLLADMGVQPATLQPGLVPATASTDTTPPTSTITSPTAGEVPLGPITVTGTATDAGGGRVGGVEVSTDNGATWHRAEGRETWTYTFTPNALGPITIRSRAADDSANLETPSAGVTITIVSQFCPCSLWHSSTVPAIPSNDDSTPLELGVKFTSDVAGTIDGIRFYKGTGNTGTHTGSLWTVDGTRLATGTFTSETATGWQTMLFSEPVTIAAGTTYIASYFAPNGHYSSTNGYFNTTGVDRAPLHAPATTTTPNGVFRVGAGFPTQHFNGNNYWVDVVFTPAPPDVTPPSVTSTNPTADATGVSLVVAPSAQFSEPVHADGISFTLRDSANNTVPGTTTYDPATTTVRFQPSTSLEPSTTYTATIEGAVDLSGNEMTPFAWSFSTIAPNECPCSLWDTSTLPAIPSNNDDNAVEVGVKFRADRGGLVTGLRFYKGAGNTGTHVGNLWTLGGTLLASATFTNETATGWQTVTFDPPVAISANTTYVASYFAPNGHYSSTNGYFVSFDYGNPPLRAPSTGTTPNGVYKYSSSSTFPTETFNGNNYWVDVIFESDISAPTVTAKSPAAGAVDVDTGTAVTATFDEAPALDTLTFELRDDTNTPVRASVKYDSGTKTVTLAPDSWLAPSTTYTATLNVADPAGNALAEPVVWSFTTSANAPVAKTVWSPVATPDIASDPDTTPVELGMKFTSEVGGLVTGVRFYKGPGNTGPHIGNLWNTAGQRLASVTFSNETASGWQEAHFLTPVLIAPNTTYIVSYFAPNGRFSATNGYFLNAGADAAPLHAPATTTTPNGVFAVGPTSTFPSLTNNGNNYWVDVVFTNDTDAPNVTGTAPANGATNVDPTAPINVTFDEAMQPQSFVFALHDGQNALVRSSVTYDVATRTASLRPDSPLRPGETYTATLTTATDVAGNALAAPHVWSFTTSTAVSEIVTLFSPSAVPAIASDPDSSAIELGMKFTPSVDGYVHGVRFYKGEGNTGTHVGSLWSTSGDRLATVTFTDETDTGWQHAYFSTPVPVEAGTMYVISYFAPNGHFSASNGYFLSGGIEVGPLRAPSNAESPNGVFSVSSTSTFPASTFNGNHYWVDAIFKTDATPIDEVAPTVTARTPTPDATGLPATTVATVTFSEPVEPTSGTFTITGPGGTPVAATRTYNAATRTMTLTPNAPLASETTYTVTVSGVQDAAGNPLAAPEQWTFTTADFVAPTVTARTPTPGATGQPANTVATATFSEAVQPTSGTFTITGPGGTPVAATRTYNAATRTMTLTPNAPLASQTTYTVTVSGVQDAAGNPLAAPEQWTFTTADFVAPVISGGTANVTAPTTATVTWATNEASTTRVDYGTSPTALNSNVSNPALVTNHSIGLTGLGAGTTYYYRVTSVDAAGNSSTWPAAPAAPATFTTPFVTITDTTRADFSLGTLGSTYLTEMANGELTVAPTAGSEFNGTSLPSGWTQSVVQSGGSTTVSGGALIVNGSYAKTTSTYSIGRSLEFSATFSNVANQSVGFGNTLNESPWAIFSTRGGGALYASVRTATGTTDFSLGTGYLGAPHRYRIVTSLLSISFYVDGALVRQQTGIFLNSMSIVARDSAAGGPNLPVHWVRLSPYSTSNVQYTSRVIDAGSQVLWNSAVYTVERPANTTVTVQYRTGNSPNLTSSFTNLPANGSINVRSRYIQYRVILDTNDSAVTPAFHDITLRYGA